MVGPSPAPVWLKGPSIHVKVATMESPDDGLAGLPSALPQFLMDALLDALRAERVDPAVLGVAAKGERSPSGMQGLGLGPAEFKALMENACRSTGNPHLGLSVGKRITEANLFLIGPVIVASPSLRAAAKHTGVLQVALFGDTFFELTEDGDHEIYAPLQEISSRVLTELALSLAFTCAQRFLGEPRQRELVAQLTLDRPVDPTPYQRAFGASVRFSAARTGIRFPRALLDIERPGTDGALAALLCEVVTERFPPAVPSSWAARVERALREQTQLAHIDIEAVAARWELSARGLRRRLEREGVLVHQLLNRVRFERASQLLARGNTPVARIAAALGYSDSSAFQRAFKRWSGIGPAAYRARERAQRAGASR